MKSDDIVEESVHSLPSARITTAEMWIPIAHAIVRDPGVRAILHRQGYHVAGNIGNDNIKLLRELYDRLHGFDASEGGMFYSLYSNDIGYRREVHDRIEEILRPVYEGLFSSYRTVINSFIVKLQGAKSGFTLHQDSTGLDEFSHSPLSLWIPLQDTDLSNGTLCIVPGTHRFFLPYRGISFRAPFEGYQQVLRRYLVPMELKAGDILAFDNRVVHYSHLNRSAEPRIVVMSGLFPEDAPIEVCYRDESVDGSPIEIYRQSDDFLVTNTAFYNNCTARPYRGEKVREVHDVPRHPSVYDFLSWAADKGITPTLIPELMDEHTEMEIVSEPVPHAHH